MVLVDVNMRPTRRQLRQFGLACLVAAPLVAWLWGAGQYVIGWTAVAGVAFATVGLIWPVAVTPFYLALSWIAIPIGIVIGELVLLLVYFGVFLPMGIVFRLMRRDALKLKMDPAPKTYYQPRRLPVSVTRYFRQS